MAQQSPTQIADTHIHILQPSRWHYHWLSADSPLNRDFLLADIEPTLIAQGVTAGILMEATNTTDEMMGLLEMCQTSALSLGVIGWIPPDSRDAPQKIAHFAKFSAFRGIRLNWLTQRAHNHNRTIAPILRACADANLVIDLLTSADHLPEVAQFIHHYPQNRFVLNHLGGIPLHTPPIWRDMLGLFADLAQVTGKLSGFWAGDNTPVRDFIGVALAMLGSDRLMFGSNIPFGWDEVGYAGMITHLRGAIDHLPEAVQADVCYGTAERVYGT